MLRRLSLAALAAALILIAESDPAKRKTRTTAPGYNDTPVLPGQKWRVHDIARPHPPVVTPGEESSQARAGRPPSDAVVLFDGKDMSHWVENGGTPRWILKSGYMQANDDGKSIHSKEKFGDAQYHIEWAAPAEIEGSGQWRGNSGILIMNRYEIQVLDSHNNPTYADGQASAIYGQYPPLVNASRKPGEWQTYDIVFEAPKFEGGKLTKRAHVTVFHNGVLVHHRQEIIGPMAHKIIKQYEPHGPEEPLGLQNHDARVRYRSIWVRKLRGYDQP